MPLDRPLPYAIPGIKALASQQPNEATAASNGRSPDAAGVETWIVATCLGFTVLLIGWIIAALLAKDGLVGIDQMMVGSYPHPGPNETAAAGRLESIARDVTGLGSNTILTLVTIVATMLLGRFGRPGAAAFLVTTAISGFVLNSLAKMLFERPRPDLSSVTVAAETSSFPSSHAMLSAVIFLALAVVITREMSNRPAAIVVILTAITATVLVGLTRVYLGIHWPSDVLTGWVLGSAWVLLAMRLTQTPRPPTDRHAR